MFVHTYATPDYITLQYRADLDMLVARWQRPVSGAETRAGYYQVLEAARQCQCGYWLLDGRRRLPADEETTRWGFQEYFPSLSAALGRRVYLSQLLSPIYQQLTDAMPVYQESEKLPSQTYQMRRFNDEAEAIKWLRECQQAAVV